MESYNYKYKNVQGKSDSLYIYVLYECSQEEIKEHIKKQLDIVDRVNDPFKRKMFSSRYFILRQFTEQYKDNHVYNCILFLGDNIDEYQLTTENKNILRRYNHRTISYKYDDHYDLDYLEDLISNNNPYHMFRVNNNKIDYLLLTKTKKVVVNSKESKPLDIMEFVNSSLSGDKSNTKYIIYGVSAKLKEINDTKCYAVINKLMKDDDLIDMIDQIDQEDLLIELSNDLLMLTDIKLMHRIVFKKELTSMIRNGQLQKLYIDVKLVDKFLTNMKNSKVDVNFKMIIIDTSIKSFIDGQERTLDPYEGVIGVTYY